MKNLFPGYFTPTDEEFKELWGDSYFAFDANVLLDLYRSTAETQQVFFTVLEKIADRVFLPHQATGEYLKNRLRVISFRSDQYGRIKNESKNLAKTVESIVHEHAILNGEEIAEVARESAGKISSLIDAAAADEPDLLRADELLARVSKLFEAATGQPYPSARLKEIYAEGAQRYAHGVPPGYRDDKKGEPEKYGDLLIWFQLIDQAKATKKPIIFVTGDAKEDWLLQHKGDTLGPRPELRQEMMNAAGVHFYIYTTPRFLEFAKQFLGLKLDTKKAESEFEKIEKQDKEATERAVSAYNSFNVSVGGHGWPDWHTTFVDPRLNFQPFSFGIPSGYSTTQPAFTAAEPPGNVAKKDYYALLPINGHFYSSSTGKWKCEMVSVPSQDVDDRVCYNLKFEPEDRLRQSRSLRLWVSVAELERDSEWRYKTAISRVIVTWLASKLESGVVDFSSGNA
jgi:hypothetical protein